MTRSKRRSTQAPVEVEKTDEQRSRAWAERLERSRLARSLIEPLRTLDSDEAPVEKPDGCLRLLTLNVAHGRRHVPHQALLWREAVERNLLEIATMLRRHAVDVVALQEADGPSSWSGNFDHVATLSRLAELKAFYRGDHNPFGIGRLSLASGTALMARLPLDNPRSHRFDASWRDTKGFVTAAIKVPEWGGVEIDVVSVHLDFLTPAVRRRQIHAMVEELRGHRRPRVVLGDLNCCWEREPRTMELLAEKLDVHAFEPESCAPTYPSLRPRRRLDWILISPELSFRTYQNVRARLSDHQGVVADLVLGA